MLFVCHPSLFVMLFVCLQFLLGVKMASRETENYAYAKFWGDKQRALWYVMVFSGVVNICSSRGAGGEARNIVQTSQHIWKLPPLSGS